MKNTLIRHWCEHNAEDYPPAKGKHHKPVKGWSCWVYTDDQPFFEKWMKENMKGEFDTAYRFNSGDPMTTVWIEDYEDAVIFKLYWG